MYANFTDKRGQVKYSRLRDRTLAVKRKNARKSAFVKRNFLNKKKMIYWIWGGGGFQHREYRRSGWKAEDKEEEKKREKYSRDCGWPRRPWPNAGRKKSKKRSKINFFSKKHKNYLKKYFFCIYILVMPKYWGKQSFAHGRFPEVGQKQKTEKKKKRERKTERW